MPADGARMCTVSKAPFHLMSPSLLRTSNEGAQDEKGAFTSPHGMERGKKKKPLDNGQEAIHLGGKGGGFPQSFSFRPLANYAQPPWSIIKPRTSRREMIKKEGEIKKTM